MTCTLIDNELHMPSTTLAHDLDMTCIKLVHDLHIIYIEKNITFRHHFAHNVIGFKIVIQFPAVAYVC